MGAARKLGGNVGMPVSGWRNPLIAAACGMLALLTWTTAVNAQDGGSGGDPCALIDQFGLERFEKMEKLVRLCEERRAEAEADVEGTSRSLPGDKSADDTDELAEFSDDEFEDDDGSRAIYGEDDRLEPSELRTNLIHPKLSALEKAVKATAALVIRNRLTPVTGGGYSLKLRPFTKDGLPMCPGESFAGQEVGSHCTGFLIAPNLLATAGHCIRWQDVNSSNREGNRYAVVFGFEMRNGKARSTFRADEVYEVKSIVERYLEGAGTETKDFAVIELDRPVPSDVAEPLRLAGQAGMTVGPGTKLGVIGYPSGLPAKVSFKGKSQAMEVGSDTIFRAQLNTFKGNSGSPTLFWDEPDVVAGILVQGENDYLLKGDCWIHAVYQSDSLCRGKRCTEWVTKSALIEPYAPE